MPAALRLPLSATGCPAGIGWHERLVVLLRSFGDDGKEKRLLPCGWLPRSIKPSVGGLPWATQSGHDDGGGIRGERFSEGHGQILPQKKKYAMQKINLAKCPQCRQSPRMSNNNQRKQAIRHDIMNVIKANGLEVTGDFWFMLIFRTESELKKIARELHIKAA